MRLLADRGELVAITPRSFCNGPYFKPFRALLLETLRLRSLHVFDSRTRAFSEDDVLQENVIFHGLKDARDEALVVISSSAGPEDEDYTSREVPYEEVVRPDDPDYFVHLVADEIGGKIADRIERLNPKLNAFVDRGLDRPRSGLPGVGASSI